MPKYQAKESDFELIPEGSIVAAKVLSIEEETLKFGDILKWKFEVTEAGPYLGYNVHGKTSTKFVIPENCKLMQWASALLQWTFDEGDGLATDDLLCLRCRILIEWDQDKADEDKYWMRVVDVMPPRGQSMTAENVFG